MGNAGQDPRPCPATAALRFPNKNRWALSAKIIAACACSNAQAMLANMRRLCRPHFCRAASRQPTMESKHKATPQAQGDADCSETGKPFPRKACALECGSRHGAASIGAPWRGRPPVDRRPSWGCIGVAAPEHRQRALKKEENPRVGVGAREYRERG